MLYWRERRSEKFSVRLTPSERRLLRRVAAFYGVPMTDVLVNGLHLVNELMEAQTQEIEAEEDGGS